MNVEFNRLERQYHRFQDEYEKAATKVLRSGWYVLGNEVEAFEKEFAAWTDTKYCVGVNSGLDALVLAVKSFGITKGDEVIVPANTYIATVMAVTLNGATPVFIEPDEYYNIDAGKIERSITTKTKAIIVVHLYGQAVNMSAVVDIAKKYNIEVIEDCAQAHGAIVEDRMVGNHSDIGCFSFFPTKNLGGFGDGGAIVTNNYDLYQKIKTLRNYGSKVKYYNELEGVNSRLDELQAALLRVKLKHINEFTCERIHIAKRYLNEIKNENIQLPKLYESENSLRHVFHLFVIRTDKREDLQEYLLNNGIKTQIHYPVPPHLAECYRYLGHESGDFLITERIADHCLSLPLYNGMNEEEINYVIEVINRY